MVDIVCAMMAADARLDAIEVSHVRVSFFDYQVRLEYEAMAARELC